MQSSTLRSFEEDVYCNKDSAVESSPIVEMLQVYTEKIITNFKANPIVAYYVHVLFLDFTE